MNLVEVINELVEERGLDRSVLGSIVCEGILAAFHKKYPDLVLKAEYDQKAGEVQVFAEKNVVTSVEDDLFEISARKAKNINAKIDVGDKIWVPFEESIGRIEILKAKHVIANKIKNIEAQAVYDAFKNLEGAVVHGNVHKIERAGVTVKVQDALAFLPKSLSVPGEKLTPGYPIKALLKDVLLEPRNENQLILDRVSSEFLRVLFELEIPEVFEKVVEIKKIIRSPGYKSKVLVSSTDSNIDPVGTCIGVGGSRIKPILKELAGEKIDVISSNASAEELVRSALKPAEIRQVEVEGRRAKVWLDDDQRSLAIGKMGQNISLASRLLDLEIELIENQKSPSDEQIIV